MIWFVKSNATSSLNWRLLPRLLQCLVGGQSLGGIRGEYQAEQHQRYEVVIEVVLKHVERLRRRYPRVIQVWNSKEKCRNHGTGETLRQVQSYLVRMRIRDKWTPIRRAQCRCPWFLQQTGCSWWCARREWAARGCMASALPLCQVATCANY